MKNKCRECGKKIDLAVEPHVTEIAPSGIETGVYFCLVCFRMNYIRTEAEDPERYRKARNKWLKKVAMEAELIY